jgi:hypothetical protein
MASRANVGLVLTKWETLNQRGDVVMSMQGWGMFGRRTPAAPAPEAAGHPAS